MGKLQKNQKKNAYEPNLRFGSRLRVGKMSAPTTPVLRWYL